MVALVLRGSIMNTGKGICEYCEGTLSNKAYRVRSEDYGVSFLNMTVCYDCHLEAKKLGLKTEELEHSHQRVRKIF
jgi:7,8-dihydro-6-hydroxymethylpterin-pyrophosphokinase